MILMGMSFNGTAQGDEGLQVGQKIPENLYSDIINYSKNKINLSDLKGKLVILDWWATTCSDCIGAMPKMEALQKEFGDKIFILPITPQKKGMIDSFWKSNHILSKVNLPSAVDAKEIGKYFPHTVLPHEIWISPSGEVLGITAAEYVNRTEIADVIAGKRKNWPVHLWRYNLDLNKPYLISRDNSMWGKPLYYTSVFPHLLRRQRNGGRVTVDSVNGYIRYNAINMTILSFYDQLNFQLNGGIVSENRKFIRVADSSRYFAEKKNGYYTEWFMENTYCMESILPVTISKKEMYAKLINDMNTYFRLNARIEQREMNCMIIRRKNNMKVSMKYAKNVAGKQDEFETLSHFVDVLNDKATNPYFIDESGIEDDIALNISVNSLTDMREIKEVLDSKGLQIVPEKRMVDVFCLDELK